MVHVTITTPLSGMIYRRCAGTRYGLFCGLQICQKCFGGPGPHWGRSRRSPGPLSQGL